MSPKSSLASSSGWRRGWIAPTVLLLLTAVTANLLARAGQPLTISPMDIAFLLALTVATGISVIVLTPKANLDRKRARPCRPERVQERVGQIGPGNTDGRQSARDRRTRP
jgi:hypothetical protein